VSDVAKLRDRKVRVLEEEIDILKEENTYLLERIDELESDEVDGEIEELEDTIVCLREEVEDLIEERGDLASKLGKDVPENALILSHVDLDQFLFWVWRQQQRDLCWCADEDEGELHEPTCANLRNLFTFNPSLRDLNTAKH